MIAQNLGERQSQQKTVNNLIEPRSMWGSSQRALVGRQWVNKNGRQ